MNVRLLVIVVTYLPHLSQLKSHLAMIAGGCEGIYVWDNSPAAVHDVLCQELTRFSDKITIEGLGRNIGVAAALNKGAAYSEQHRFDAVMCLDQDSVLEHLPQYRQRVEHFWNSRGLCVCCPIINEKRLGNPPVGFQPYVYGINSGMMIPMPLLRQVGGWDENLFVDAVDTDFCLSLSRLGLSVYHDNDTQLRQHYGEPTQGKFLWFSIPVTGYSPQRIQSIFRNHIVVWRRYNRPAALMRNIIYTYLWRMMTVGVVLADTDKWLKVKAALTGIYQGFRCDVERHSPPFG